VVDGSIEVDVATNDVGGHVGMMAGQEEHS
jgi:hypothetical protein